MQPINFFKPRYAGAISPSDANGIANIADPDQGCPLSSCPGGSESSLGTNAKFVKFVQQHNII